MLKFRYRRCTTTTPEPVAVLSLDERPDLRIRNLLDDPRLRRSMGLPVLEDTALVPAAVPPLDRRRLLDRAAA